MTPDKENIVGYDKWAITVVGYNRPKALRRVLDSVFSANYNMADQIDLIISLDYCDKQAEQKAYCETLKWNYGKLVVRCFDERQGLKKHILHCGELTNEYKGVIILEDDLIVAPAFFSYVKQAVEYYGKNDRIAGISLYCHQTNPGNGRRFEAQFNGADAYLMKYAQSWGQCWTREMWEPFITWLSRNEQLALDYRVPDYVLAWNDKSWLKYHIAYTAITNRYFVYPYFSLSSNNSDAGEHNSKSSNAYQVLLTEENDRKYQFYDINDCVKYDAFFEREFDIDILNHKTTEVLLDLYGLRNKFGDAKYLISSKDLPYPILQSISLHYRPQEKNVIQPVDGNDIFLYELHTEKIIKKKTNNKDRVISYDLRALSWKMALRYGISGLIESIKYHLRLSK